MISPASFNFYQELLLDTESLVSPSVMPNLWYADVMNALIKISEDEQNDLTSRV